MAQAYVRLRKALGLPPSKLYVYDFIQQLALVEDDVLDIVGADVVEVGHDFYKHDDYWADWKGLRYRKFRMKDDVEQYGPDCASRFGLVAQEVQGVFPSLVTDDGDHLGLKYSVVNTIGGKVLQEAQARIEALESEVENLKARLN